MILPITTITRTGAEAKRIRSREVKNEVGVMTGRSEQREGIRAVSPELATVTLGIHKIIGKQKPVENTEQPGSEIIGQFPLRIQNELTTEDRDNLRRVLDKKDEEARYVLKLIDLAKEEKLPAKVLSNICKNGAVSENIKSDTDRYYKTVNSGKSVEDEFVPLHKNTDEAQKSLPVGEVFRIEGQDKIFIKTGENTSKQLKFDSETYLKLYPPIGRFATTQGDTGDCYLLSSINAIMENPYGRVTLYDRFEQVEGGVNVSMPGSKAIMYCPNCRLPKGIARNRYSNGTPATQLLEHAYGADFEQLKYAEFEETISTTLADLENRLKQLQSEEKTKKTEKETVKLISKIEGYKQNRETVREKIATPGHKLTFVLDDYDNLIVGKNGPLTKDIEQIDSEYKTPADYYRGGTGGFSDVVLRRFGFETTKYEDAKKQDRAELDDVLMSENPREYIIAGGTHRSNIFDIGVNPDYSIYTSHAYKITPANDENGNRVFKVSNPWNNSHEITMNIKKLKRFFTDFYVAKIKSEEPTFKEKKQAGT